MDVLSKISLLAPENCLKVHKVSIVPLSELMHFSAEDTSKIEFQWTKLNLIDWKNISNTATFWTEVSQYKDASGENPFNELCNLAKCLLVLPWSNAEVERAFSQLNLVKTGLRNRMGNTMINAILTIRAALRRLGKCCRDYEFPDNMLKDVANMTTATYTSGNDPVEDDGGDVVEDEDLALLY